MPLWLVFALAIVSILLMIKFIMSDESLEDEAEARRGGCTCPNYGYTSNHQTDCPYGLKVQADDRAKFEARLDKWEHKHGVKS